MVEFTPGLHLLIDLWGAKNLQNTDHIKQALMNAASACNATVLMINLHSFGEQAGVTGVAMLAESHISIHTWPEIDYAAIDIFTCGSCDPYQSIDIFKNAFLPAKISITEHKRGINNFGI